MPFLSCQVEIISLDISFYNRNVQWVALKCSIYQFNKISADWWYIWLSGKRTYVEKNVAMTKDSFLVKHWIIYVFLCHILQPSLRQKNPLLSLVLPQNTISHAYDTDSIVLGFPCRFAYVAIAMWYFLRLFWGDSHKEIYVSIALPFDNRLNMTLICP